MFRIGLLTLGFLIATAPVMAREIKLSGPNSGACPESASANESADSPPPRAARTRPAPDATRAKPTVHSDAVPGGRLQSPRWHSFLPGMVR
ncbi:hypothetical protein H4F99_05155 [Lysobacter sp. SG-8]|uniref:Secreted protein n=1 Tax=Marilutibacter penaei TaxID=2759900 RepID=A0A7W3U2Q9_9GAMM|nr:hypothetical protein [Lysobacter penaei]MBB1087876.1 hypothetical protein [Lysobacter penaei]